MKNNIIPFVVLSFSVAFVVMGSAMILISTMIPSPGRTDSFLMPDWSIAMDGTNYEIGTSADGAGYEIWRWKSRTDQSGQEAEYIDLVMERVERYAFDDPWILADTETGLFLVNVDTHRVAECPQEGGVPVSADNVNEHVCKTLRRQLEEPTPSPRAVLVLIGASLIAFGMAMAFTQRHYHPHLRVGQTKQSVG